MSKYNFCGKQYFDNSGSPLISGYLLFEDSGTSNAKTVYSDSAESIPVATVSVPAISPNPLVQVTAAGRPPEIWFSGLARVTLYKKDGTQLDQQDEEGLNLGDISITDDVNNAVSSPLKVSHKVTNNPANGIGVGIEFEVETSNNNYEIGAIVDAICTDVTPASEDFKLRLRMMLAGLAATGIIEIDGTSVYPTINDSLALGKALQAFSDVFLGNGAVININNGAVTITHSASLLTVSGAKMAIASGVYIGGVAAANLLDDYEEGSFTFTLKDVSGNNGTLSGATGYYTKIGDTVFFFAELTVSSVGAMVNVCVLDGLPFPNSGSANGNASIGGNVQNLSITAGQSITGDIPDVSASQVNLYLWDLATGTGALMPAELTGAGKFTVRGFYKTAA